MEKPLINDSALFYLNEARKWAKFLAILGFIGIGIMVLGGIIMGTAMSFIPGISQTPMGMIPSGFFVLFYLVMAIIYFFPVYYLYRFSVSMGISLNSGSESELSNAFRNLRAHYKFVGILIIVSFVIGLLAMIIGIFAAVFGLAATHMQM